MGQRVGTTRAMGELEDMRILLIDDESLVRSTLERTLAAAGYEVVVAADGAQGISVLESDPCELVITDILMPQKEGIETIFEIRKRNLAKWIIAISGGGRAKNMMPLHMATKAGADLILAKPVRGESLLNAVQALTAGSAAAG